MKNLITAILFTIIISTFPSVVSAETVPITTGDYFDVELVTGTQSPWTKKVPITIKFRSNIDAKKVELSWDAPSNLQIRASHPKFIEVSKGSVYVYKAYVKPTTSGTYNIAGNVTAWELETNYTSSGQTTLTFGGNLVTVPKTPGYDGAVIIRFLILTILFAGIIAGIIYGVKLGFSRLKEWLKPPE